MDSLYLNEMDSYMKTDRTAPSFFDEPSTEFDRTLFPFLEAQQNYHSPTLKDNDSPLAQGDRIQSSSAWALGRTEFVPAAEGYVYINSGPIGPSLLSTKDTLLDAACYSHSPPDMPINDYNSFRQKHFAANLKSEVLHAKLYRAEKQRELQFVQRNCKFQFADEEEQERKQSQNEQETTNKQQKVETKSFQKLRQLKMVRSMLSKR